MSKATTVGELARQYVAANRTLPSRTIARMLVAEAPEVFASIDIARSTVRYVRGNIGQSNRKKAPGKYRGLRRESGKPGDLVQIPPGQRQGWKPFAIKLPAKVLVLSDLHVPYHDEQAIECALRKGVDEKCDAVYLNGDGIDFHQLSRWVKDPRSRRPREEVDTLLDVLDEVAALFPTRYYKAGNHEERWETYLYQRAADLADFEEFELHKVLKLDENKWRYVRGKQRAVFGHLNVLHGHEMPRGMTSPVNPARGVWLRIKSTCLVGHFHQSSQHTEMRPLAKDSVVSSWSSGCLCDLSPEFSSINGWNHGFAIVDIGSSGEFYCHNFRVISGKVYPA